MGKTEDKYLGTWVLGQYHIERILSKGGNGTLYLARQASMDRYAAIKILTSVRDDKEARGRFRVEARAASRLIHPNIITVYNFGELADSTLFLAMEYVAGSNLHDLLDSSGPLPPERAVNVALQCAAALGYAHSRQVVHRDFKPGNVMINPIMDGDYVKVLDFGLARLGGETTITQSGSLVGTPRYMAPEQWQCQTITARTDQYALGQVIWEMLVGQSMVDREAPFECMHVHLNVKIAPPSQLLLNPAPCMELLDPIVLRMLAKNPAERFKDMQMVTERLKEVADALAHERVSSGVSSSRGTGPEHPAVGRMAEADTASINRTDTIRDVNLEPARTCLLGGELKIAEDARQTMECLGISIVSRCSTPEDLARLDSDPDLYVLGISHSDWSKRWLTWTKAGIRADRTLVCIDAVDIPRDLVASVNVCNQVMVASQPIDPLALGIALSWIQWNDFSGVELMRPAQAVQVRQLTSPSLKSSYVDDILEDMASQGLRQRTLRALAELSEEMIMNAFFRSESDQAPSYSPMHMRAREVNQWSGNEVTLRWFMDDRHIVLSVRDPFGSLSPEEIFGSLTSKDESPDMGLRIMSRAARHLFFAICPGTWSEMLAIVEREPTPESRNDRSLCVLFGLGQSSRRIGDRLTLSETRIQDFLSLELEGEINETSDFRSIFRLTGMVHLNMRNVSRINSMGVHAWLEAARSKTDALRLVFEACSLAVVSQINMIPKFAKTARISSIMAPYFCESCNREQMELLRLDDIRNKEPPTRSCSQCEEELEFDELPQSYFSFMDYFG